MYHENDVVKIELAIIVYCLRLVRYLPVHVQLYTVSFNFQKFLYLHLSWFVYHRVIHICILLEYQLLIEKKIKKENIMKI